MLFRAARGLPRKPEVVEMHELMGSLAALTLDFEIA